MPRKAKFTTEGISEKYTQLNICTYLHKFFFCYPRKDHGGVQGSEAALLWPRGCWLRVLLNAFTVPNPIVPSKRNKNNSWGFSRSELQARDPITNVSSVCTGLYCYSNHKTVNKKSGLRRKRRKPDPIWNQGHGICFCTHAHGNHTNIIGRVTCSSHPRNPPISMGCLAGIANLYLLHL